jgi:aspartate beta-hydroxylase
MTKIYDGISHLLRWIYRARFDGPPVLDCDAYFPDARKFIASWRRIRDEALAAAGRLDRVPRFHDVMPEQAPISANDGRDWRVLMLKAYGTELAHNMARCPALASILAETPEVLSASISFMAPGKHIPRHCGPFRGVLRFHLGLSMPIAADGRPAAILMIDGCEHRIADGEGLLWDDTYPHEAWNNSDQVRAALTLDVWRPGMPTDMSLLSRLIVRVVQLGMKYRGVASDEPRASDAPA